MAIVYSVKRCSIQDPGFKKGCSNASLNPELEAQIKLKEPIYLVRGIGRTGTHKYICPSQLSRIILNNMKLQSILLLMLLTASSVHAQTDSTGNAPINMAQTILNNQTNSPLTTGLYAEIDYNQPLDSDTRQNGKLDVHRLVTFLGYRFNSRTHFVSEIEIEHVKEIYVEQAFLNYAIKPHLNVRAGLMLIPMGIVNEYHEPTTFNGVERPNLDGKIVPTTWREMGAGLYGRFDKLSMRYQLYLVNGFLGYDGTARLRGSDGFRKGRQKGAESVISSPNLASKVEYYGLPGLKLGASLYSGKTQSTMYDGLALDDESAIASADSTVVGMTMFGADFRYGYKGFQARGQFIYSTMSDVTAYNAYTGSDLGSAMMGYYLEVGYDLFNHRKVNPDGQKLTPFIRYEQYNTHQDVTGDLKVNQEYDRSDLTAGLTFHVSPKACFKADYQQFMNASEDSEDKGQLNMGIGVWF